MSRLYEVATMYAAVQREIEDAPDQEISTALTTLDSLEGVFNDKAVQVGFFIRNMEALAGSIAKEEKAMAERRCVLENKIAAVKNYLFNGMQQTNIKKIECPQFVLAIKKNPPRLNIIDAALIDEQYMRYKPAPPPEPDKKAIMDDLKQGVVIEGVEIVQGERLDIK